MSQLMTYQNLGHSRISRKQKKMRAIYLGRANNLESSNNRQHNNQSYIKSHKFRSHRLRQQSSKSQLLPPNQWPKSWHGMRNSVCRLRVALYGHPLSGAFRDQHSREMLLSAGFESIHGWECCYLHRVEGRFVGVRRRLQDGRHPRNDRSLGED